MTGSGDTNRDVVERAIAAHALVIGPDNTWAVRGCTEMYAVIPELIAEVERLRRAIGSQVIHHATTDNQKLTAAWSAGFAEGSGR